MAETAATVESGGGNLGLAAKAIMLLSRDTRSPHLLHNDGSSCVATPNVSRALIRHQCAVRMTTLYRFLEADL